MAAFQEILATDGGRIALAAVAAAAFALAVAGLAVALHNRRLLGRVLGDATGTQFREHLADILRVYEQHVALEGELRASVATLEKTSHGFFDTVDIEHYDAFTGQAGRFSFSALLLNRNGSGFVLTSLTSTQGSKVYIKHIQNGTSDTALSREEEELLRRNKRP